MREGSGRADRSQNQRRRLHPTQQFFSQMFTFKDSVRETLGSFYAIFEFSWAIRKVAQQPSNLRSRFILPASIERRDFRLSRAREEINPKSRGGGNGRSLNLDHLQSCRRQCTRCEVEYRSDFKCNGCDVI